jgi:hypothetical protein
VRELLDAGVAVLVRVERGLRQAQRERAELEHLAAPLDGLLFEVRERHDRVDKAHVQRVVRVVLAAQEPDLLGALGADDVAEHRRAEAAVPRAHPRPRLAEDRVVGGDRQVAQHVQDVAAADGVALRPSRRSAWAAAASGRAGR